MRGLVKWAKGEGSIELRDIPVPQPGPGEALIRVKAAAVCASDVHLLYDRFPSDPPVVIGHEFSGVVERLGAGVEHIGLGDAVVSENNPQACGTCRVCALGFPNLCPAKKAFGFKSDGCFAEYVKLPANLLHKIPADVSFDAAALCEPLAVATGAVVDRCGIADGDTVVVLGPGAVGLLAAQVARAEGAQRVIVAGTDRDIEHRLACGRRLGFETCNIEREDLLKRVLSCTGGMGADMVVEAAGAEAAVNLGVKLLRRAGCMVVAGITGKPAISVAWDELVSRGATVAFSYGARKRSWDKAIDYLADGRVETEPLISNRLPLDRWEEAFSQMERMEGIRILLLPPG